MDKQTLPIQKIRVDKWLWAARFFRTRTLAKHAIESAKVQIDGKKIKTSREIRIGDTLSIRQGKMQKDEKDVVVLALSDTRGPAPIAQTLYKETDESLVRRTRLREYSKLAPPCETPNKKQRRDLAKLKNKWQN